MIKYLVFNDIDKADFKDRLQELIDKYGKDRRFEVISEDEETYRIGIPNIICSKERLEQGNSIFKIDTKKQLEFDI